MPHSITCLYQTCVFEWRAVKCQSNNGHTLYTCITKIGPYAQTLLAILDSIVNIIWGKKIDVPLI